MSEPLETFVLLRCLIPGKHYPDYNSAAGPHYCGAGDIIHVAPDDAAGLIAEGWCEEYETQT